MDLHSIIGITAGILTSISFIPQVYKTYKSKSAKDLSLGMFIAFCAGVALWLVYGIMAEDMPIILANSFTLAMAGILLYFKFTYKD